MAAVVSLLVILSLSILVTRIATVALIHTGLSRESARFQARSAFTGSGFTTKESEQVVGHPVRRRIIMLLMLLGNAGIISALASLILTFIDRGQQEALWPKIGLLVAGVSVLWLVAMSHWVDRHLSHVIDRMLRRYSNLDVRDYAGLMRLAGEYSLAELEIEPGDWLAHKKLADTGLRQEGIVVLGIKRPDGTYLGAPQPHTEVQPKDHLLVYGRDAALEELDKRRAGWRGEQEHREAVEEQERVVEEEERKDLKREQREQPVRENPRREEVESE